jgi:hypothetical protein
MKRYVYRLALPSIFTIFAMICHTQELRQYRERLWRDMRKEATEHSGYIFQHAPAVIGRISLAINFPALALNYPISSSTPPMRESTVVYDADGRYQITVEDIGFFFCAGIFWWLVGGMLDRRRQGAGRPPGRRRAGLAVLSCGLVFGFAVGAYATVLLASRDLPWEQIGAGGVAWALVLVAYFSWRLATEVRDGDVARRCRTDPPECRRPEGIGCPGDHPSP